MGILAETPLATILVEPTVYLFLNLQFNNSCTEVRVCSGLFFLRSGFEQWLHVIIQELHVLWQLQLKANKIWFSHTLYCPECQFCPEWTLSVLPRVHTLRYNPAAKTALIKCLDFSFHTFLARKTSLFLHKYSLQQSSECNRWARTLTWLMPQVQNGFTRFFCLANLIHTLKCDGQTPRESVCAFLMLTTIKIKRKKEPCFSHVPEPAC